MKGPARSVVNRSHRGEAVVSDVLEATLEELARVGFRALRIEQVATRANVNRTTIYRRWPTKEDLVRATLGSMFGDATEDPATGSIRGDLMVVATHICDFLQSPNGQVLVRMVMAEGTDPELRAIADSLRQEKDATFERILERWKARGALRADLDNKLFIAAMIGGMHHHLFVFGVPAAKLDLARHVDLLLHGAAASPAPRAKKSR